MGRGASFELKGCSHFSSITKIKVVPVESFSNSRLVGTVLLDRRDTTLMLYSISHDSLERLSLCRNDSVVTPSCGRLPPVVRRRT